MKPYYDEEDGEIFDNEVVEEQPPFSAWLREWGRTRNYLSLLAGAPAILALAALLGLGVFLLGWQAARAGPGLRSKAEQAVNGQDFETARVAYQSLLRLGGKQAQRDAFQLMQTFYSLGRPHEAALLALQLAPLERLGYPPAHVFVARSMLAQTNPTPVIIEQATSHLERALRGDPANTDARELLCQVYLAGGQVAAAKRHLLELATTRGDAMLRLARVLETEGDASGVRSWAERAVRYFRAQTEGQSVQDPAPYLSWAGALVLLEDYPGAFQVLQQQWRKTVNPTFQSALARVCADWAQWLQRKHPGDLGTRFRAVQEGLELDPNNVVLIQQLANLTLLGGAEGERARALADGMMREGRNTGLLHFCLGGAAWDRGDKAKAFEHFRLAYEVAPQLPLVANNMALTLTLQEQPQLDRALAIAESLVQQHPRNPAFRDTRGQVLVKLGRTREALADLAFALPLLEDRAATHRALAQCYRGMGLEDLATEHERAATAGTNAPPAAR